MTKFFWPIGDRINGVQLYMNSKGPECTRVYKALRIATISEQLVLLDCFCLNQDYDCVNCLHLVLTRL